MDTALTHVLYLSGRNEKEAPIEQWSEKAFVKTMI